MKYSSYLRHVYEETAALMQVAVFFIGKGNDGMFKTGKERRDDEMATVNVGFQVLPKVANGNTYDVVDKAIEVVQKSGVKYEVGAMETVMEGELDELLEIVKKAQNACIEAGASEVMTYIKIHYRPNEGVTLDEKLRKYR
jgi:uncharacterized protein (TIGR00106 family)